MPIFTILTFLGWLLLGAPALFGTTQFPPQLVAFIIAIVIDLVRIFGSNFAPLFKKG